MRNIYKLILVLTAITVCTSGCYNTLLPIRIATGQPDIPVNSIEKEIPRYANNNVFVFYKFAKQKQKQLNLTVPENGYDSLLLRFWFTYPDRYNQMAELLEIRINSENKKIALYTKMQIFFNTTRDCEVINFHKDTIITEPKNGWSKFMDEMHYKRITQLPTIENLKEYKSYNKFRGGLDYQNTSLTVAVEVATKTNYRFFQYNGFDKYKMFEEVNNMYSFIKYLRTEFYMIDIDPSWYKD